MTTSTTMPATTLAVTHWTTNEIPHSRMRQQWSPKLQKGLHRRIKTSMHATEPRTAAVITPAIKPTTMSATMPAATLSTKFSTKIAKRTVPMHAQNHQHRCPPAYSISATQSVRGCDFRVMFMHAIAPVNVAHIFPRHWDRCVNHRDGDGDET